MTTALAELRQYQRVEREAAWRLVAVNQDVPGPPWFMIRLPDDEGGRNWDWSKDHKAGTKFTRAEALPYLVAAVAASVEHPQRFLFELEKA